MSFFTSADITLGTKLLEVVYIVMGLITIYTGAGCMYVRIILIMPNVL